MSTLFPRALLVASLLLSAIPVSAQNLEQYLSQYFTGQSISFGYGGGTSSNNPRVELVIQYCGGGIYYSTGRSCRPNIIAKGYQCNNLQDSGRWRIAARGGQAEIQWRSNNGTPGTVAIRVRGDGIVVDPRGNPFNRIGIARCR